MNLTTELDNIANQRKLLEVQQMTLLEKAFSSSEPAAILKAQSYYQEMVTRQAGNQKSIVIDPFDYSTKFGYKNRRTAMSYDLLRKMALSPVPWSIITTRT
ncbi:MAG: hypothetical protein JHC54_05545, partial [Acinetobacter sp.]|nr:hypothetical protein [Acinetobacter sp.]